MKSNLSPETLELLARGRDAAQELPFDAEALLAEVNAQVAGGATSLAPKAASSTVRPPQDHGFMYAHGFEDLDGHIWELAWMDTSALANPTSDA